MSDPKQQSMFDDPDELAAWREHWQGMPEFVQEDLMPWKQVTVNFANREELTQFAALIGQSLTTNTRSIWFKKQAIAEGHYSGEKLWIHEP